MSETRDFGTFTASEIKQALAQARAQVFTWVATTVFAGVLLLMVIIYYSGIRGFHDDTWFFLLPWWFGVALSTAAFTWAILRTIFLRRVQGHMEVELAKRTESPRELPPNPWPGIEEI